jgi:hypothetical protein
MLLFLQVRCGAAVLNISHAEATPDAVAVLIPLCRGDEAPCAPGAHMLRVSHRKRLQRTHTEAVNAVFGAIVRNGDL